MRLGDAVERVVVIAPHADDEVLGCGGLLARLRDRGAEVHVVFAVVDGDEHYGHDGETTLGERGAEIASVASLFGFTHEILYRGEDLMERLDTRPKRELVDAWQRVLDDRRPELVLLPCRVDYDQDHVRVAETAFAALRPMPPGTTGKWFVPHVLTYESPKLGWADQPLPTAPALCDVGEHLEDKLEGLRRYATQFRAAPHVRSHEAVTALATTRGALLGVPAAEAFGVLRTEV